MKELALSTKRTMVARKSGLTLMELILVSSLIAVIATLTLLSTHSQTRNSKLSSTANTATMINRLATLYRTEKGVWPKDVDNSIAPSEIASMLPKNLFRSDTPIGGRWDWNGPGGSLNVTGISVRYPTKADADLTLLRLLDELMDDGNLTTGQVKTLTTSSKFYLQFSVEGT